MPLLNKRFECAMMFILHALQGAMKECLGRPKRCYSCVKCGTNVNGLLRRSTHGTFFVLLPVCCMVKLLAPTIPHLQSALACHRAKSAMQSLTKPKIGHIIGRATGSILWSRQPRTARAPEHTATRLHTRSDQLHEVNSVKVMDLQPKPIPGLWLSSPCTPRPHSSSLYLHYPSLPALTSSCTVLRLAGPLPLCHKHLQQHPHSALH